MIQQVNFKFNNYEEFREFILNELPNFMPKEYMRSRVMISDTIKINGRDREIISFVRPINVEENIMAIAIKDLFHIYTKSDFNTMLNKIKTMANFTNENNMNKESIMSKVMFNICKKDECKFDLNNRPYRGVYDLIIYYAVVMNEDEKGRYICPIDNDMMEKYDITKNELYNHCINKLNNETEIKTISNATMDLINKFPTYMKDTLMHIHNELSQKCSDDIIIISNDESQNASINIINDKILKQVGEEFESDYYISLINKSTMTCFPKNKYSISDVKNMINDENNMLKITNKIDRILTNKIYLYKRNENKLYVDTK